jgi:DNA-binding MarR family transcriptional regulator
MALACVCTIVRRADRALYRLYEDALEGSGLTVTQFSILRDLQRDGASPLSRLAASLAMERTSLYRTISALEKNGTVSIKPGPNRKIRVAHLTATGEALIARAMPAWQSVQSRMIDAIGAESWAALSPTLKTIPNLVEHLDSRS